MLTLTEAAKNRIIEVCKEGEFLRIDLIGGGCHGFSYKFLISSEMQEDDFTIKEPSGRVLVAMRQAFLSKIKASRIDFIKNISSSYFVLESENFDTKCGCGTSFSLKS